MEYSEEELAKRVLDLNLTMEERIQAAFKLENAVGTDAIKTVAKGLFTDPSPIVRHEFAFVLGETAAPDLVAPYLMKSVEEDPNVFVRHEAILALATLGKKEFIPFVERFCSDPVLEMAETAQIALQRLHLS